MKTLIFILLIILSASLNSAFAQNVQSQTNGGILDDTLLDSIDYNYRNKRIAFGQARAMNLGTGGADVRVTMKLRTADGKTLGTFEANALAPKRNKSFLMQGFPAAPGANPVIELPGAGSYFLEFWANGKVFDRFPFSLSPYAGESGESWFLIDGLWNDHALLDTSKEFKFSFWMRDMLEGTGKRSSNYGKYFARIVREKDGKVIGTTPATAENSTIAPRRVWTRYDMTFVRDANQSAVGIYDITAQDGAYFIEFTHDGKIYGKYPFTVTGGKLRGVSEFSGNELETAGGDLVWMKRK